MDALNNSTYMTEFVKLDFPKFSSDDSAYIGKLQNFFNTSKISNGEKVALFLRSLPDDEFNYIGAICTEEDIQDSITLLGKFKLQHPSKTENAKLSLFYAATQGKDETFSAWVTRVARLNKECKFNGIQRNFKVY
ncbi:unnamed protein product [Gordionus sp. m RMFG-2023]